MTYPLHLKKEDIVNLGSYYTHKEYIEIVWNFIKPYINKDTIILDPACGYGDFLYKQTIAKKIGNDIDETAINIAKTKFNDVEFYNLNALVSSNRRKFNILNNHTLIIIGNPPYNDITSQSKKKIKKIEFEIDEDLKTRDIGISFFRMFNRLKADIISVLHPLSYLVKKVNFNLLKDFKKNYKLIDGIIISSKVFNFTSKNSEFPIIIALYKKDDKGMDFEYIKRFKFKTINKKEFSLNDFDYIGNYINKYPKKNIQIKKDDILFYTLRDINALKRNKTFIDKPINNAVKVDLEKLDYYVYVDVFKDFIDFVPFYLRNLDIIFNKELFEEYKSYFISYSLKKNKNLKNLKKRYDNFKYIDNEEHKIKEYMKKMLKGHYNEDL